MIQAETAQAQAGQSPIVIILTRGQPRPVDDLTNPELEALSAELKTQLATVAAMIAYRSPAIADAEIQVMGDYYEALERGRYEVERDALDHHSIGGPCHA